MWTDLFKLRMLQGDPIVHNVRNPVFPERYRGFPVLDGKKCAGGCTECVKVCPSAAVTQGPVIDMGKCVFCGLCAEACPESAIKFTGDCHTSASDRDALIIRPGVVSVRPEQASARIKKIFGRSLKLRQVSAGGCNGCELELSALSNVNFDMGRYGVEFVASPRHADGIVITGPITQNMAKPLDICYDAVPAPKIVILTGACAISGGIFAGSTDVNREFLGRVKADLYVPGCPPHPLTFINCLLDHFGKKE